MNGSTARDPHDIKSYKIDASEIADPFRKEIRERINFLKASFNLEPCIVGFLANDDKAARKYADWTRRACKNDGINFELREIDKHELERALEEANNDPKVHGLLIYYPCFGAVPSFFGGKMDDYLRDIVSPRKDVEGLSFTYRHNLYHNRRYLRNLHGQVTSKKCLLPCTPLAIVKALEFLQVYKHHKPDGERLHGLTITVINRSEIVGRPLAAMLANDGADVYSVDIDSIYLMRRGKMMKTKHNPETACRISNVIVTGVPSKTYQLNHQWIMRGTIIINVSNYKNVDEEELLRIPGVKYVPLIGKVTVAMLERNLIRLIENFHIPGQEVEVIEAGGRIKEA